MNILVLGGSGIISSSFVEKTIDFGHNVTIVNRGKRKSFIDERAKLIKHDLKRGLVDDFRKQMESHYDFVVDFVSYEKSELIKNMLACKGLCDKYVFISTAVVYKTKKESERYCENDDIGNNAWSYSTKKIECESFLRENYTSFGLKTFAIVRPYITYNKTRIPLQIGPIEYYTIINRAKNGKVIPVLENDVRCTIIHSNDFALKLYTLLFETINSNTVANIVGNEETTWNSILIKTLDAFGIKDYKFIKIPFELVSFANFNTRGLNFDEVVGDKSRNMLFDKTSQLQKSISLNSFIPYSSAIKEIVEHFSLPKNQTINYAWDGRIDHFLIKYFRKKMSSEELKALKCTSNKKDNRIAYFINRYNFSLFIKIVLSKIKSLFSKK